MPGPYLADPLSLSPHSFMPSSNSRESSEPESSRKRRRPNSLAACDACQSRKTRCDMISRRSCHRCHTLGLDCLFMGNIIPESLQGDGHDSSLPSREWTMITRLEQRTSRLEAILARLDPTDTSAAPSSETATAAAIDPVKEYYKAYNEGAGSPLQTSHHASPDIRLGAYLHVSSMLSLNHSPTFADPEEQGIIQKREMRRMVDDLPRLLPEVFPLTQVFYSLACANQPMVKSCILHNLGGYTVENPPSRQTHANTALVLRNLAVIPAAEPTIDLALSLLILSFSPASRTDASLPRTPDPYEASARAMRVALRLGLNKAAVRLARRGLGALSDQLNELVLWYGISHRSAWVDLLSADSFAARPSIVPLLCEILSLTDSVRPDLIHLWLESRLIHLIRPLSSAIVEAQCTLEPSDSAVDLLYPILKDFSASIVEWRRLMTTLQISLQSASWLTLHGLQIEMMAYIKVSNDFEVPTRKPSGPDAHHMFLKRCYSVELRRISMEIIHSVLTSRLVPARLPAYNLTICFAAYALARPSSLEEESEFDEFRQLLIEAHVAGGRYVQHLDARRSAMTTTRGPSPQRDDATHDCSSLGDLDSMLDISWLLDPAWSEFPTAQNVASLY